MDSMVFWGKPLVKLWGNLGCFQVEEFMSTDELGDKLCCVFLLSELGMVLGIWSS